MHASYLDLILLLLAVGCVGGFLSGLLGVGGGIIFVPALYFCLQQAGVGAEYAMHVSIATSLAVVLVTAASSAFWHHKKGSVDFSILKSWGPYAVIGVATGTWFAAGVGGHFLKQFFAGMTLLTAAYMAFSHEPVEGGHHRMPLWVQRGLAIVIGAIAALIGVGGAMMNIPLMAYNGVPMRKSVGTGGVLGFVISLPAIIGYILSGLPHQAELPPGSFGYVNGLAVAVIIPVSLILSPIGVHVSHTMPRERLRRIFAVVLVLVSIRMFMTL